MKHSHAAHEKKKRPYLQLVLMGALHLPLMYFIMFAMVNSADEVVHNMNTFYMAVMMVAPMIFLMPLLMREMYPDKKLNLLVYASSIAMLVISLLFTRQQTFIGDRQFLKSMIPHHSGAVLMCEKAKIQDAEIRTLCDGIIKGQKSEIDQMKRILERL